MEGNEMPAWAKSLQESIDALTRENAAFRTKQQVLKKAEELGIPSYLVKNVELPAGADVEKELTELRQKMVEQGWLPKNEKEKEEDMRKKADEWAMMLADKSSRNF